MNTLTCLIQGQTRINGQDFSEINKRAYTFITLVYLINVQHVLIDFMKKSGWQIFFKYLFKQLGIKTIAICQKYDCLVSTNLIYKPEKFLEGFETLFGF